MRERILAQPTPMTRLQALATELRQRAIRPLERRAEIEYALQRLAHAPDHPIAPLCERVGLSPELNAVSVIFIVATAVLVISAHWLRQTAR